MDDDQLSGRLGLGLRLPAAIKSDLEPTIGHDLSGVRIHHQGEAARTAAAFGARAYTFGDNVVFAPGAYRPGTPKGRRLLAHELGHVAQQREGRVRPSAHIGGTPVNRDASLERDASHRAARPGAAGPAANHQSGAPVVQMGGGDEEEEADYVTVVTADSTDFHRRGEGLTLEFYWWGMLRDRGVEYGPISADEDPPAIPGPSISTDLLLRRLERFVGLPLLPDLREQLERLGDIPLSPATRYTYGRELPAEDLRRWFGADRWQMFLDGRVPRPVRRERSSGGERDTESETTRSGSRPRRAPTGTTDQRPGSTERSGSREEPRTGHPEGSPTGHPRGSVGGSPEGSLTGSPEGTLTGEQEPAAPAARPTRTAAVDWGTAARTFGETIAMGLAIIVLVGVAVGLEIITLGTATVFLVGLAGAVAGTSYLNRREEIEDRGYDVPASATAVHAAGDAFGVSQLIEGVTGEQLGTDRALSSEERGHQLGAGAGGVVLILTGSRAFRGGARIGQTARLSGRGNVPPTTEGGVPTNELPPAGEAPPAPRPSEAAGPREIAARDALPEDVRVGFDIWMDQVRGGRRPGNPETILEGMPAERVEAIARQRATQRTQVELDANRATRMRSDPLDPDLANVEMRDGVRLRYETREPAPHEIQQGAEIARETGEPVEIFGDTPGLRDYPGIDGVIGEPPRPLSLKNSPLAQAVAYVRVHAADAFASARANGYSHVEVHIRMQNTVAEIQAAWNGTPANSRGTGQIFDGGGTIARYIIRGTDGTVIVEPPITAPSAPTPTPPASGGGSDGDQDEDDGE